MSASYTSMYYDALGVSGDVRGEIFALQKKNHPELISLISAGTQTTQETLTVGGEPVRALIQSYRARMREIEDLCSLHLLPLARQALTYLENARNHYVSGQEQEALAATKNTHRTASHIFQHLESIKKKLAEERTHVIRFSMENSSIQAATTLSHTCLKRMQIAVNQTQLSLKAFQLLDFDISHPKKTPPRQKLIILNPLDITARRTKVPKALKTGRIRPLIRLPQTEAPVQPAIEEAFFTLCKSWLAQTEALHNLHTLFSAENL